MRAKEYAKAAGYDDAVFLHVWRGYRCYKPVAKGQDGMIGLPLIILEKGKEIRMSTPEEALEHFDERGWK